ncbi:MAG: Cof-type HAD-IIB family hydrolase [Clostridia bacterium]|nr:Cof-type HAD-IIB family hydrolase [Clostridia bacterium]
MNKIRILALDIDDTIVDSTFVLKERTIAAIRAAHASGVKVVLCTGRGIIASKGVRDTLNVSELSVCFGGSLVVRESDGKVLHSVYMSPEDVSLSMNAAFSIGLHSQLYQGDYVVIREENEFTRRYTKVLALPFIEVPDILERRYNEVPKVLVYSPPEHERENLEKLRRLLPSHLHLLTSKPGFIEIGAKESTKGRALQWIADYWGVSSDEVVAIGDNTLDMDMIEWAGIGCCVDNGNPMVKERADMVIPSCSDEGVAWFIENFIL